MANSRMTEKTAPISSLSRDVAFSTRSRLALVWQTTNESDFFGTDEIAALQVRRVPGSIGDEVSRNR